MDHVIEEVDEKFEKDANIDRPRGLSEVQREISLTTREAYKIINRSSYRHIESDIPKPPQSKQDKKKQPERGVIGKFNYYGKKYRFEESEEALHFDPPNVERSCITQRIDQPVVDGPHAHSQKSLNQSRQAEPANSLFFDDGKISFPAENYFIYFDKPSKKVIPERQKVKHIPIKQQTVQQKFQPAWLMNKKIDSLQRELKAVKEREKKLGNTMQSLQHMQRSDSLKGFRKTTDFPIQIQSSLERMVDSLLK